MPLITVLSTGTLVMCNKVIVFVRVFVIPRLIQIVFQLTVYV